MTQTFKVKKKHSDHPGPNYYIANAKYFPSVILPPSSVTLAVCTKDKRMFYLTEIAYVGT